MKGRIVKVEPKINDGKERYSVGIVMDLSKAEYEHILRRTKMHEVNLATVTNKEVQNDY